MAEEGEEMRVELRERSGPGLVEALAHSLFPETGSFPYSLGSFPASAIPLSSLSRSPVAEMHSPLATIIVNSRATVRVNLEN